MVDRRNITDFLNVSVKLRRPRPEKNEKERLAYQHDELLLVRADDNRVVATVCFDDLFDEDGNRFNND